MKLFTCRDFTGHYPVGAGAVVVADNEDEAAARLNRALREIGLVGDASPENMIEFPHPGEEVRILADGKLLTIPIEINRLRLLHTYQGLATITR